MNISSMYKVCIGLFVVLLCSASALADEALTAVNWMEKAKEYQVNGETNKAIDAYSQAVQLDANNEEALAERGKLYIHTQKFDLAIEDFSKVLAVQPRNADLYWLRGIAYAGKGNHDKAIIEYNKTLRIEPNLYMAYWCSALSYERMGTPQYAMQEYTAFIEKVPSDYPNIEEAKKRLARWQAWDKARVEATAQSELVGQNYVFDFLKADGIMLNLANRQWQIAFKQAVNNQLMIELVPEGQTISKWSELITVQFDAKLKNLAPENFVGFIKKHYLESYEDKAEVQILSASPSEAVIEYKVVGQPGLQDEHTITRVIKGNTGLILLHYAVKPQMTEEQRKLGLKILEESKYVNKLVE